MCCSASASQYAALEIVSNSAAFSPNADHTLRIVTGTSPTATPTVRVSGNLNNNYSGRIALEYSSSSNTFSVFVGSDTNPYLTPWTDSGNVIAHGADFRQAAIYANFGASGQIICDNFTYKDV